MHFQAQYANAVLDKDNAIKEKHAADAQFKALTKSIEEAKEIVDLGQVKLHDTQDVSDPR